MRFAFVVVLVACGGTHPEPVVTAAPPAVVAAEPPPPTVVPIVVPPALVAPHVVIGPVMEMSRVGPAVVVDGDAVYAIGGENSEGRLRSAEMYQAERARWERLGVMTVPRVRHTATLLDDGQVLVAGGGYDHPKSRLAELWDGSNFVPAGRMISVRSRHTATRLPDGRVLVIGGRDEHDQPIARAELWDPKTQTWHAAGRLSEARCCHTSTLLGDGRVLVVGGLVPGPCWADGDKAPCYQTTSSVELWDPKTGAFTVGPPLGDQLDRAAHTATLLHDGRVLIAGGSSNDGDSGGDPASRDAIWSPETNSWRVLEHSAFRVYHTATLLEDGSVVFIGGQRDLCGCCKKLAGSGEFASSIVRYDPATDQWNREGESLLPRDRHGAALLPDGSVLVIGGESKEWGHSNAPFGSTERWTR
jgi:hypothetical protein